MATVRKVEPSSLGLIFPTKLNLQSDFGIGLVSNCCGSWQEDNQQSVRPSVTDAPGDSHHETVMKWEKLGLFYRMKHEYSAKWERPARTLLS